MMSAKITASDKTRLLLINTICSALEYLVDRGEIEVIKKIDTKVRYKRPVVLIEHFDLTANSGKKFRITAEEIK